MRALNLSTSGLEIKEFALIFSKTLGITNTKAPLNVAEKFTNDFESLSAEYTTFSSLMKQFPSLNIYPIKHTPDQIL